jgi:hypothetical protein
MRPLLIVMAPPGGEFLPRFPERGEPFHIQAFIPQTPVEALNEAVLHGPPRPDKNQLHPAL